MKMNSKHGNIQEGHVRNKLCGCGSGLKFKKCCLVTKRLIEEEKTRRLNSRNFSGLDQEIYDFAKPKPSIPLVLALAATVSASHKH